MGTFEVRKPKVPEGCQEVTVRENSGELTLRAEEVGSLNTYINVNRFERGRWGPLLVDADWYAFCQALCKGIEGEDWEYMYDSYKVMSRAVGVRKPQEAQKAKASWVMKAAKEAGEEHYDPKREDKIKGRNETRLALLEEHLKDPIGALDKALKCVWKLSSKGLGPKHLGKGISPMAAVGFLRSLWEKPVWEGTRPPWDPMDSVWLRTASME